MSELSMAETADALIIPQASATRKTFYMDTQGALKLKDENGKIELVGHAIVSITDSVSSGTQDTYGLTVTGFDAATQVRLDATGQMTIRGISTVTASVHRKTFINVSNDDVTFRHLAAGPAVADQIIVPGGVDFAVETDGAVVLEYDSFSSKWRVM